MRSSHLLAIGIDNYHGDWDKLNNAVSDTKAIVEVLTSKYFFELIQPPLYNEEATKENILLICYKLFSNETIISCR